jgi:hypothetical protein
VFNNRARTAHWVGPDDGYYSAEFNGDARTLSTVLADFAKLDVRTKRLVVRNGVGPNFQQRMDWVFNVWVPALWERPSGDALTFFRDPQTCPPPEIVVYTGGKVRWSDVIVPKGIEVRDERLEAHGFTLADGAVLEGKVVDLVTHQPLAARMRLERIEPQPMGKDRCTTVAEVAADAQGRWVLKKAPAGWYRVVVAADGYVPRLVENYSNDNGQPGWHSYNYGLSHSGAVSGHVVDEAGKPLADVEVWLDDVVSGGDGYYSSVREYVSKTDAEGRFHLDQVPIGSATIRVLKSGYCLPGFGQPITTPAADVVLNVVRSSHVRVTVACDGTNRSGMYVVEIQPAPGAVLPTWEQARDIETLARPGRLAAAGPWIEIRTVEASDEVCFDGVPPGRYSLQGWPSPFSSVGRLTPFTGIERSKPLLIELKSGQTARITLPVK